MIVDEIKLFGTWQLSEAQYYQYNEILDTYRIINADNSSDINVPVNNAVFFDTDTSNVYKIYFSKNIDPNDQDKRYYFNVIREDESGVELNYLLEEYCHWEVKFNTLYLEVDQSNANSSNFWFRGFELDHSWPLIANETIEIYINATDCKLDNFIIPVITGYDDSSQEIYGTIDCFAIKATFTLQ